MPTSQTSASRQVSPTVRLGLLVLRLLLVCGLIFTIVGPPVASAKPHRHHSHHGPGDVLRNRHRGVGSEIVGGTVVPQGTFSFASLLAIDVGDGLFVFCGGSLIAPRFVLTAAHCVADEAGTLRQPTQLTLTIGRANILNPPAANVFPVAAVFQHPDWDPRTLQDDVALLQLSQAVPSTVAQPIPLIAVNDGALDGPGEEAIAAGWGFTVGVAGEQTISPDLRQISTTVISDAACEAAVGGFDLDDASVVCAQVPGKTTCQGDSGGPLLVPTVESTAAPPSTGHDRPPPTRVERNKKHHHHHHGGGHPPPHRPPHRRLRRQRRP